jgi:hypothetical protein
MSSHPLILTLDQHGVPHRWVSWQHACIYVARDLVAWDAGDTQFIFHGGTNRVTGERSELATSSIIAIRGKALSGKSLHPVPPCRTANCSTATATSAPTARASFPRSA